MSAECMALVEAAEQSAYLQAGIIGGFVGLLLGAWFGIHKGLNYTPEEGNESEDS